MEEKVEEVRIAENMEGNEIDRKEGCPTSGDSS